MTNATNPCHAVTLIPIYTHAVRVSSASARGAAKGYAYWGAATYVAGLRKDGVWTWRCASRASSDRRSLRLARLDAEVERERLRGLGRRVAPDEVAPGEVAPTRDPWQCV